MNGKQRMNGMLSTMQGREESPRHKTRERQGLTVVATASTPAELAAGIRDDLMRKVLIDIVNKRGKQTKEGEESHITGEQLSALVAALSRPLEDMDERQRSEHLAKTYELLAGMFVAETRRDVEQVFDQEGVTVESSFLDMKLSEPHPQFGGRLVRDIVLLDAEPILARMRPDDAAQFTASLMREGRDMTVAKFLQEARMLYPVAAVLLGKYPRARQVDAIERGLPRSEAVMQQYAQVSDVLGADMPEVIVHLSDAAARFLLAAVKNPAQRAAVQNVRDHAVRESPVGREWEAPEGFDLHRDVAAAMPTARSFAASMNAAQKHRTALQEADAKTGRRNRQYGSIEQAAVPLMTALRGADISEVKAQFLLSRVPSTLGILMTHLYAQFTPETWNAFLTSPDTDQAFCQLVEEVAGLAQRSDRPVSPALSVPLLTRTFAAALRDGAPCSLRSVVGIVSTLREHAAAFIASLAARIGEEATQALLYTQERVGDFSCLVRSVLSAMSMGLHSAAAIDLYIEYYVGVPSGEKLDFSGPDHAAREITGRSLVPKPLVTASRSAVAVLSHNDPYVVRHNPHLARVGLSAVVLP